MARRIVLCAVDLGQDKACGVVGRLADVKADDTRFLQARGALSIVARQKAPTASGFTCTCTWTTCIALPPSAVRAAFQFAPH